MFWLSATISSSCIATMLDNWVVISKRRLPFHRDGNWLKPHVHVESNLFSTQRVWDQKLIRMKALWGLDIYSILEKFPVSRVHFVFVFVLLGTCVNIPIALALYRENRLIAPFPLQLSCHIKFCDWVHASECRARRSHFFLCLKSDFLTRDLPADMARQRYWVRLSVACLQYHRQINCRDIRHCFFFFVSRCCSVP